MDINAPDFIDSFDASKATVGIIGQGFVGGAMKAYFERKLKVVAFDKYKSEFGTLEDLVKTADIIFVCVPTPMRPTGECYTGIVEACVQDIKVTAKMVGRPLDSFIIIFKSTIPIGFTDSMKTKHPELRFCFSPEFLTEKNAIRDMIEGNRVVVGGDMDDAKIVLRYFLEVDRRRVEEGKVLLVQCAPGVAEMTKLYTNGILFTKVLFSNEIYALCQKLGIPYDEVRLVSCLDPRIGSSHTVVPGPDGLLGAGGHCFPKDMHNLKYTAQQLDVPERLFTAVLLRNGEVREDKDWERMKDRAVTDK